MTYFRTVSSAIVRSCACVRDCMCVYACGFRKNKEGEAVPIAVRIALISDDDEEKKKKRKRKKKGR